MLREGLMPAAVHVRTSSSSYIAVATNASSVSNRRHVFCRNVAYKVPSVCLLVANTEASYEVYVIPPSLIRFVLPEVWPSRNFVAMALHATALAAGTAE